MLVFKVARLVAVCQVIAGSGHARLQSRPFRRCVPDDGCQWSCSFSKSPVSSREVIDWNGDAICGSKDFDEWGSLKRQCARTSPSEVICELLTRVREVAPYAVVAPSTRGNVSAHVAFVMYVRHCASSLELELALSVQHVV